MSDGLTGLRHRRASAALLLAILGACSSWQVQPVAPAELLGRSSPSQVRVQLHDGRRVVVGHPALRSDSLVGTAAGAADAVAVTDIDSIAVRRFDLPRTLGLTVLIFAVPAVLCAATCEIGPSFGH